MMNIRKRISAFCLMLLAMLTFMPVGQMATGQSANEPINHNDGAYSYQTVNDDPLNARIYTLGNGLKVYLSKNEKKPSIQTYIAVNAGAKNGPTKATGLAHYLEHIMFKGTSNFGTMNWEKEKPLLNNIESMFEHYRTLEDEKERKAYYAKIDSVSQLAAQYTIPNEYDKLMNAIGAQGTNAYTSYDETVYVNNVPSNQLENFLRIESERFGEIVPRLFHTELEAVYEEKNRMSDGRQANQKRMQALFKNHPYGTRTTIGTVDDLKNPSISEIKEYFSTYYVPNNVAIILAGDLEYDKTIRMIDQYFGSWKNSRSVPEFTYSKEESINDPLKREVTGPSNENVSISFRLHGRNSKDYLMADMLNSILNSQVGLVTLDLKQKQKVQNAATSLSAMEDYSIHGFYGMPKQGQSLDEVKKLLLDQIEKIKQGKFDAWMIDALVANIKKRRMASMESNGYRARTMLNAFTKSIPWEDAVNELEVIERITKQDIVEFARRNYNNNYVVVYKRKGKLEIPRVEKPVISKINLNKNVKSNFQKSIIGQKVDPIEPKFVDFDEEITIAKLNNDRPLRYMHNDLHDLYSLSFVFEKGNNGDPKARLASQYLQYLSGEQYTAEEFKKEMFKLGSNYSFHAGGERSSLSFSGIDENMGKVIELVENHLRTLKPNPQALQQLKQRNLQSRENAKSSARSIKGKLRGYVQYGPPNSQMKDQLNEEELKAVTSNELISRIQETLKYEYFARYYGPRSVEEVKGVVDNTQIVKSPMLKADEEPDYELQDVKETKVYWTHYDQVQADIFLYKRGLLYDFNRVPKARLYNSYFGGGMSSVLFQELREAQGLAYSVSAGYSTASEEGDYDSFSAYIGTQADKLPDALPQLFELVNNMPKTEAKFASVKESMIQDMNRQRITGSSILGLYDDARDRGLDYDYRRDLYNKLKDLQFEDIEDFQQQYIKDRDMAIMVIGKRDQLNFEALGKYGEVQGITLEELFGY